MAVDLGSTKCPDGFAPIRERTAAPSRSHLRATWFVDGAGGGDASTTAAAITTWINWIDQQPFGESFHQMLPILGEDGSIGMLGTDSPAKGKIQAKTGTTAALDASNGHLLMRAKALAGYLQPRRRYPVLLRPLHERRQLREPPGPVHSQQGPRRASPSPSNKASSHPTMVAQVAAPGRIHIAI